MKNQNKAGYFLVKQKQIFYFGTKLSIIKLLGELITVGPIKFLVPRLNERGIENKDFKLEILKDERIRPNASLRMHNISEVYYSNVSN